MKTIIALSLFSYSIITQASTINHKNCELFLNTQSAQDFFRAVKLNSTDVAAILKGKGYQAISYISQPTLDRHVPLSGDQEEDLLSGELSLTVINPKSLKSHLLLLNNKKNPAGMVINSEFMRAETVVNYKRLLQKEDAFYRASGLEFFQQIPNCEITL